MAWPVAKRIIIAICTLILILLGGFGAYMINKDGGPHVLEHPSPQPSGAQRFYSGQSSWPTSEVRAGAEVRVLNRGLRAAPATVKPLLSALFGGAMRQNTRASCYLNEAGTDRVCVVTIRRGGKPWAKATFKVANATGAVTYKSHSLYRY